MFKETGPERLLVDESDWIFGYCFEALPLPDEDQTVFRYETFESYDAPIRESVSVVYVDGQTGREVMEFRAYPVGGMEREMTENIWQEVDYQHPITGDVLRAEVMESRVYQADKRWRRRKGVECRRQVFLLSRENWSPGLGRPKPFKNPLEVGMYEQTGEREWTERYRTLFFRGVWICYEIDPSGDMVGGWPMFPEDNREGGALDLGFDPDKLPQNLGPARVASL